MRSTGESSIIRRKGIGYDTGSAPLGNRLFRESFDLVVPGANYVERIQTMVNSALLAGQPASPEELERRFNAFFGRAAAAVRDSFASPVTYASGPWERVDWSHFDIVGVDLYRDASNRSSYRERVRANVAHERPLAVTEFGCCTYRGAQDRGATGWAIVDRAAQPPRLTEDVLRDEQLQADELVETLGILDEEGVDGAFWFTFASFGNPYHEDPRRDLDRASHGVVKILDGATGRAYPNMPWEPKRSFYALADYYGRSAYYDSSPVSRS